MTGRLLKYIFIQTFLLTWTLVAVGQSLKVEHVSKPKQNASSTFQLDTSRTAIIPLKETGSYPFNDTYKQTILTKKELAVIDSLVDLCVEDYNQSFKPEFRQFRINLQKGNYRKQLVAATNTKGEKEVWVNCFCRTWDNRWKKEIMYVDDGGNCYFNLKINLTSKKYYDLGVNGGG
jgi:hypothetical protein